MSGENNYEGHGLCSYCKRREQDKNLTPCNKCKCLLNGEESYWESINPKPDYSWAIEILKMSIGAIENKEKLESVESAIKLLEAQK